jgi:hypothetical protein
VVEVRGAPATSLETIQAPKDPQATCSDRFDSPIQKPSITWMPGSSADVAAPRVTKSGE